MSITFSMFTKHWNNHSIPELGDLAKRLGFDGIELPVRPNYPVTPENVETNLLTASKQLADQGINITSVAGPTNEGTIAACAEAGIPVIRTSVAITDIGYLASVEKAKQEFDEMVPLLEKHNVAVGIQNHCDQWVCNAMGLRDIVAPHNPKQIGVVWCAAHNALNGEDPDMAIDIIWSHLSQVKFKNAFWDRQVGPEAEDVRWRPFWTTGRQGLASWTWVAEELTKRGYNGVVCLDAEYNDEQSTERLIADDLAFAKTLF